MKRINTLLLTVIISIELFAQAPEKMSYQAVIRNSNGQLVTNQSVGMQISLLQGSTEGSVVYSEIQVTITNENGLASIEIGDGITSNDFSSINWQNGPYFIKTEIDPTGGTNYTITGTSQLLSVPYALHAKTADNLTGTIRATTYSVGDFAQGGVVFWVDETGQHGLVCAAEDQLDGNFIRWYAGTCVKTKATANGVYAGKSNTLLIIAAHMALADDDSLYAARVCNELKITQNGVTYGDWYLPSLYELHLMFLNKSVINNTALANGGDVFTNTFYWSSTEASVNGVAIENMVGGYETNSHKSTPTVLRAIRAF